MNKIKKKQSTDPAKRPTIYVTVVIFWITVLVVMAITCGAYYVHTQKAVGLFAGFMRRGQVQYIDPIELVQSIRSVQIVDLRSGEEFKKAHVKGAFTLPTYEVRNGRFDATLPKEYTVPSGITRSKPVVLYGPSAYFSQKTAIATHLAGQGYDIYLLTVGWNELRHFQNIWIPESLWGKIDINNYIVEN